MYFSLGSLHMDGARTLDAHGNAWHADPERCKGWWGGPASTLTVVQNVRRDGGVAGLAYRAADHLRLGGVVHAPDEAARDAAADLLKAAASIDETILVAHQAGGDRWARVRREGIVEFDPISPAAASWSVGLVMLDPRRFGKSLTAETHLPSTSGGLTIPLTVPFSIPAVTVSGQVSLTNRGTTAGPVVLRIDGPVVGPVVTHVSSGRSLVFASSLSLAEGQFVLVDMERRTVLENGQASRNGWITERGWSQFQPGVNTWSFTAVEHDPASRLTITATEAWE